MDNNTINHFAIIVRKGFSTGTRKTDTPAQREARTETLIRTMEKAVAADVDGKFASAQFEGTPTKEAPFVIYTTKIFPSGLYHCECNAFKRSGAQRQNRPCKHATALARVALHDAGKECKGFTDPRHSI